MSKLKSTHQGEVDLNGFKISCAVLNDENKTRVFSERTLALALGIRGGGAHYLRKKKDGAELPEYLSAKYLKPYITNELIQKFDSAFSYVALNGAEATGVDVTVLPDICDIFIRAKQDLPNQKNLQYVSDVAYKMMRGFATVGIIALVDEATGYQDERVKDALQQILDKYLLADAKKYEVTFPLELYKQWFKLNNWEWRPENAQKRPGILGTWTNKYIYDRIAPGLLKEIQAKNPKNEKGRRDFKNFQFLTDDIGEPRLREFFGGLIALARATTSWRKYIELVERAYPAFGDQTKMQFPED